MKFNLFFSPGAGLGDKIISKPILEHLIRRLPYANIHVVDCGNIENYKTIIGSLVKYISGFYENGTYISFNAYVNCNEICKYEFRLTREISELMPEFMNELKLGSERIKEFGLAADNQPFLNNQIANQAVRMGLNRVTLPQYSMGMETYSYPKLEAEPLKMELPKNYITMNDGWETTFKNRTTKAYGKWQQAIDLIKEYGIPLVQLGSLNNGESYDVDVQLRGKTTLAESFSIIKNAVLHLDIEGGITWAASALGTKCIVLHGPTHKAFFGLSQNENLSYGECSNCWWIKRDWNERCLANNPICMNHNPKTIAEAVAHNYFTISNDSDRIKS